MIEQIPSSNGAVRVTDALNGSEASAPRTFFPTGFVPLDAVLDGGISTGELCLLGGLPGIGKTIAMLQFGRNAAAAGMRVVYACYEHDIATLLGRLLLMEIGDLTQQGGDVPSSALRRTVMDVASATTSFEDAASGNLILRAARSRVASYGDLLLLHASSAIETDVQALAEMATAEDIPTILFVDYLQKVPGSAAERTDAMDTHIAVSLKELAMRHSVAVVAAVGASDHALHSRRLRLHQLRDAAGLGYEADLVIMLNDKVTAVSKRHSAYDPVRAEEFKRRIVFSIEKHRAGPAGIHLEFRKDFVHYRFDPMGEVLEEQMIDGTLVPD